MGDCLLWVIIRKLQKYYKCTYGLLFRLKKLCVNLNKNWVGLHFGRFFHIIHLVTLMATFEKYFVKRVHQHHTDMHYGYAFLNQIHVYFWHLELSFTYWLNKIKEFKLQIPDTFYYIQMHILGQYLHIGRPIFTSICYIKNTTSNAKSFGQNYSFAVWLKSWKLFLATLKFLLMMSEIEDCCLLGKKSALLFPGMSINQTLYCRKNWTIWNYFPNNCWKTRVQRMEQCLQ
jgi:hypothetical protein